MTILGFRRYRGCSTDVGCGVLRMSLQLSSRELALIRRASSVVLSPTRFPTEERWHVAVMEAFARLTGAYKVGLRLSHDGDYRMVPLGFEESAVQEYREYYHRFDFGRALGGESAKGSHVLSTLHHFAGRIGELHSSEYFCDYIRRYKVFDTVALSTRRSEHQKGTVIYLWHEKEMTSFQRARALSMVSLLAPAFRSGMTTARSSPEVNSSLLTGIDIVSDGCALFSNGGVILHRNPALSALIAECADSDVLKSLIAETACAVKSLFFDGKADVALPYSATHSIGGLDYRLSGVLLNDSSTQNHPAILVTVVRLRGVESSLRPETLQFRFGLTGREAEVALMLRARKTNMEIASRLGVSVHTARHHTESVLRKLGVEQRTNVARRLEDAVSS